METFAELDAPVPPAELFAHVERLDRYPAWIALVHRATPSELDDPGDDRPAWDVELRTRVGPLARSKRLRMVRTRHEPDHLAVFERAELDGRDHAEWVLHARIDARGDEASRLTMHLRYGGHLWTGGVLERVLDDEIRRGSERLLELVTAGSTR